jgi:hypothetical protein
MGAKKRAKKNGEKILTQELLQQFVELLMQGNYMEVAATALGVHLVTVRQWMFLGKKEFEHRGRGGIPDPKAEDYYHFYMAVTMSLASSETSAVGHLTDAGGRDWRASLAFLERRFPKRWGKVVSIVLEEQIHGLLDRLQSRLTEPEFRKVLQVCSEEGGTEEIEEPRQEGQEIIPV